MTLKWNPVRFAKVHKRNGELALPGRNILRALNYNTISYLAYCTPRAVSE
jgi:hypothetical protein